MTAPNPARILIVDDSPQYILALQGMLGDDYAMSFATSGPEALETLATQPKPDLILLDVTMPEMDGYAVCTELKANAATREIPVIFVTACGDALSESRALTAGGVDFISKPTDAIVLRARVAVHLALHRQTQALAQANTELTRHRDHLEDQVQERTRELAAALDAAQSVNRAKDAFLATMGHELRTPINHIVGLAYLLERAGPGTRTRDHLAHLQQSSRHLLTLVDNVLQYAAREAETPRMARSDFVPALLLDQAAEAVCECAQAKGIELVRELDPALPPWLQGDPQRLGQVLGQLLDNAVKFSDTGPITLRARVLEAQGGAATLRLEVEDRGIGIAPERQPALFQPFEPGDNSFTRRYGGTGLGLALCRRLADLMGGTIGMASTPDRGSTFWLEIRLPLGEAPPTPPPVLDQCAIMQRDTILAALEWLLTEGDWSVLPVWKDFRHELAPYLGERAANFERAMERLDLGEALRVLRPEALAPAP